MAHYPFAHRRKAMVYPWADTVALPTFTDFEFIEWYEGFFNASARLGEDLPNANLTDLLSVDVTLSERRAAFYGIQALYRVKASSVPGGWTIGLDDSGFTHTYWTVQAGPVEPNSRGQRRNLNHKYYIVATLGFNLFLSDGVFSHGLGASGRYSTKTTPLVADFTETDIVPTLNRRGRERYAEHNFSGGPADLAGYSSGVTGFGSNVVRDHLLAMQTTLDAEIAAMSIGMAFRIAAMPWGVSTTIPNTTGASSLDNFVPQPTGMLLEF